VNGGSAKLIPCWCDPDPNHSFGQPVIKGTNITVETIYSMLNAGESPEFVASVYELNLNAIEDVMSFMKRNVA